MPTWMLLANEKFQDMSFSKWDLGVCLPHCCPAIPQHHNWAHHSTHHAVFLQDD